MSYYRNNIASVTCHVCGCDCEFTVAMHNDEDGDCSEDCRQNGDGRCDACYLSLLYDIFGGFMEPVFFTGENLVRHIASKAEMEKLAQEGIPF